MRFGCEEFLSLKTVHTLMNVAAFHLRLNQVRNWKLVFLFLNQNICCGCSKEPSQWDVSLSTQNTCLNWWIRKYSQFYAIYFRLTGHMGSLFTKEPAWRYPDWKGLNDLVRTWKLFIFQRAVWIQTITPSWTLTAACKRFLRSKCSL